jgi:high potential iron-sulfur protein
MQNLKISGKREREIASRRIVLRGALAAGYSLWVPMLLSGCDSKKGADSTSPAPASPPATSAKPAPAAPAATGKVAQATVQYQLQPKGDQKCSNCMHFIAESNTCKLVEGQISPEAWCSLWAKKA